MRSSSFATATVLATAIAAANGATAQEYTLLTYETPAQIARRADGGPAGKAYWGGFNAFAGGLAQAGVLKGGTALTPDPAAEGAQLSGYFVVDVADEAAARGWAAKAPVGPGGRVTVHAHVANPAM